MKSKTKYYIDPNTLTYQPVQKDQKQFLHNLIKYFAIIILLSIPGFFVMTNYRLTPHEWLLSKQNEKISNKIINKNNKIGELRQTLIKVEENDEIIYRPFAGIKSLPQDIREAGFGGIDRYRKFAGMEYSIEVSNVIRNLDKLKNQIEIQKKSFDDIEQQVTFIDEFYASKPAIRPISKTDELYISSYYGRRFHPVYKRWKMHHGIDYASQIGSPVYATGKGIVKSAHYASGYGRVVKIDHSYGYLSIYAHLNKYTVKKGDSIKRGDLIGYVGNTGISTGPHLHYEIRKNNRTRNPLAFYIDDLKEKEYQKIVSK